MDFIEGLPKSDGYSVIMVVVDRLSKFAHFVALRHPFSAASVATLFVREIIRLHGVPQSIISDRDKVFVSHFWREVLKYQGTTLKRSTAYHPQTDGQTKVVNRSVETYLRCFVSGRQKEWVRWLPWAEYWYNTSYHSGLRMTPFRVLYGLDPPTLLHYDHGAATTFEVDKYLQERDRVLNELKGHLLRAQQLMKEVADGKRRQVTFEIGDLVYLKLRQYRQVSVTKRLSEKLSPRFYGPFEVIERIGQVAYRLQLPPTSSIHPVFHVSQLKRAIGSSTTNAELPEGIGGGDTGPIQPVQVRGTRVVEGEREVLIQWSGLSELEATWESYERMLQQFPLFHLEDKVLFKGGGDDTYRGNEKVDGHWGQTYSRRTK